MSLSTWYSLTYPYPPWICTAWSEARPATSEASGGGIGECFLESVHRTEGSIDRRSEFAAGGSTGARGGQNRPEEGVIEVPASVVSNGALDRIGKIVDPGAEFLDALRLEFGAFDRGIELRDIGGMVLRMVDVHGLRIESGLKRVFAVRKIWMRESHRRVLLVGRWKPKSSAPTVP